MATKKNVQRSDHEILFSKTADSCKWFDKQFVKMLFSNFEEIRTASIFLLWRKESASKF